MKCKIITGYFTFGLTLLIACLWSFWGIIENFHEGWYYNTFTMNLKLMLYQYIGFAFLFIVLNVIGVLNPKAGALFYLAAGIAAATYFNNYFFITPFFLFTILYWFSEFGFKKWLLSAHICLPLLVMLISGFVPAYRVSQRVNDFNLGLRLIKGNEIELVWAPDGPGFPKTGVPFAEAIRRCAFLNENGTALSDTIQNIWHLPDIDEIARSMTLHNVNCRGFYDEKNKTTVFETTPDKETPLWNPNSQIIYWWTANEVDSTTAYIIVYNGKIYQRKKNLYVGYLGFRAVKNVPSSHIEN